MSKALLAKAENLQMTGSFKFRGAYNAMQEALARRAQRVIAYSAGNHGRALVTSAQIAGVPYTVVMPETATPAKVQLTQQTGAEVVLVEPDTLVTRTQELAQQQNATLIHPFDAADIVAGQGTLALEIIEQLGNATLDAILVPVGGGGLIAGIAIVVKTLSPHTKIIAVEPEYAADLSESFTAGHRVSWDRTRTGRTIADGLRSPCVGEFTWKYTSRLVDEVFTVSEDDIITAVNATTSQTNTIVEPSAAVAIAAATSHASRFPTERVAAVISGGNIALEQLVKLSSKTE